MTPQADDDLVVVGVVVGVHGLRGEVKVRTGDPAELHAGSHVVARGREGAARALVVRAMRPHKGAQLTSFDGVDGASAAEALRGAVLLARRADLPALAPDTYRDADLIGFAVRDERLGELGAVAGVLHYPHADMLVVGDRSLLVPMLAAYGVRVDLASRSIATALPEGFEEL